MGKHEYKGVRAQRAEMLAVARREEKQRMRNAKYGITTDPRDPVNNFYPRNPRRPSTPRPNSAAGLAMRNAEAVRGGFVDDEEKKKETVTQTSWKYLHTCVGLLAVGLIGGGLLVGVTGQWMSSNAGKAGIACMCCGVGIVIFIVLFTYIRYKHTKMKRERREKKAAKAADVEAGKKAVEEEKNSESIQMRPMSSRPKSARPKSSLPDSRPDSGRSDSGRSDSGRPDSGQPESGRPKSGRPKSGRPKSGRPKSGQPKSSRPKSSRSPRETDVETKEGKRRKMSDSSDEEMRYRQSVADLETSDDKDLIVTRSSSRTSMNLQGSINMGSIPEDEEGEGDDQGAESARTDTSSVPGIIVTESERDPDVCEI